MATVLMSPASVPLDADQQRAANHRDGTACVAAAAGSGKTTLLVGRAIALVEEGATPASVVTLAFNRNAQATLRERLRAHPATAGHEDAMASTFHAFALGCCRLMMPNLTVLGVSAEEGARVAGRRDGADVPRLTARDLGKKVWDGMGGSTYGASRPELVRGTDLDEIMAVESGARERLFATGWPNAYMTPTGVATPEQATKLEADLRALHLRDVSPETLRALVPFMPRFRAERMAVKQVDFPDMMVGLGNFVRQGLDPAHPKHAAVQPVMARLRAIQHLQVDEAQDGNELRWYIAQSIAGLGGAGRTVMAVGDLRQSIAGFAGAEPRLFREWWDRANKQYALPNNYRSASAIVAAGNAVAKGEPWNIGGDSIAARADLGIGSVRVEAIGPLGIAVEIASAIAGGMSHKDVTVLARTKAALEQTAFGLRTRGLKAFVRGGGGTWRGMDGRMILAYLRFAEGIMTDKQALGLALNSPKRFVSPRLLTDTDGKNGPWTVGGAFREGSLFRDANRYPPAKAVRQAMEELSNLIWEERVAQVESWLIEGLEANRAENAQAPGAKSDKADLIRSLCEIARVCGSLLALDMAIEAETKLNPKDPDVIELSTIHQSKGDQWRQVYVTGVKEGVFPHMKASDDEAFAEEVRLLYVAVTRPISALVVDVATVNRFADKVQALEAVAATTTPPPPATPPPAPERTTEPSSEPLVTFPETPSNTSVGPAGFVAALMSDEERAYALATDPEPGERFVSVRWDELLTLLGPHGFVEDASMAQRAGQRVLAATLSDGSRALVYTSVPPGAAAARGLGEDSIKVVLLDPHGKPYSKRMPYVARTRNWRVTLLNRLAEATQAHPALKG